MTPIESSPESPPLLSSDAFRPPAWIHYGLLGLALGLVVITAVVSLHTLGRLAESVREVGRAQQVLQGLSELAFELADSEYAHLSYLLLRDEDDRVHYVLAKQQALARTQAVLERVGPNPAQRRNAQRLLALFDQHFAATDAVIEASAGRGPQSAIVELRRRGGRGLSQGLRQLLVDMQEAERTELGARQQAMRDLLDQTRSTLIMADSLAVVAGVFGLLLLRRSRRSWERQRWAELEALRARRQSDEKSLFLANMSHEIRTPMNAIFGFTQLLGDLVEGERERHYVRAIAASGRTLLTLINDILDLSKIEAGRLEIAPQPTPLRELIDEVLTMFSQLAADKRLALRADVALRVPRALALDPHRVRQVLANLVGNAVKYTDSGGVLVRAWCSGRAGNAAFHLHVAVEDSGIGIAPDQLERIFEPFVQADQVVGRREGTGLGLSISRRLVEAMRGELRVASTPGRGSVFELAVPTAPAALTDAVETAPPADGVQANRLPPLKLLIVDDVRLNRELLQAMLADSHHQVQLAEDGAQAIELARRDPPDVVLMDVRMPGIDGVTARDRIRADVAPRQVRMIAVTASVLDDDLERRAGFDDYVRKPFTREEVLDAIARAIGTAAPPATPAATPAAAVAPVPPPVPLAPAAGVALRGLLAERWPPLVRSMAMREVGGFAAELLALGEQYQSHDLVLYGRRLRSAVDLFDVLMVESALAQFPSMLRQLGVDPDPRGAAA